MPIPSTSLLFLLLLSAGGRADSAAAQPDRYFAIQVVDQQTGRGVPMVELQTTSGARYYTDSNGLVAFYEPGLMDKKVWFGISAHGYEFPPDGFGNRGVSLTTKPGSSVRLQIRRLNIAERLYRITGQGIYRDTVLLGRKPPIAEPLLNGQVTGQDGILTAIYRGKLYWFYGDTNRLSYTLGNFAMTGATTELPDWIDPSVGFNLRYFVGRDGFARPMAPKTGEGVVWLFGLVVLPDERGRERMLAYFQRRRGLGPVLENGFVVYNDQKQTFEKLKDVPLDPPVFPQGYPLRVKADDGTEYLYFTAPYPALRVRANWTSYLDLASYEGYTCLKPGARSAGKDGTQLDRDPQAKLIWGWKKNTPPLRAREQRDLIAAGKMKREESPFDLQDADGGKPIVLNSCSCFWNDYRQRYIMIASEVFGATMLGEVWYSQSDRPEGPWLQARKIITHANKKGDAHDFYNPTQHPFFDQDGGRVIYLEGSYVNTFSGNPQPTPYYEYNQIMYRLDLSDPRLRLPPERKLPHVLIQTELGDIEVELEAGKAPVTTANFLKYVDARLYDGGQFHRTVKPDNQPDNAVKIEVIQAGINPREKELAPIKLERTRDTGLAHKDGTISMARDSPDTATGDFFICIGDQPSLDYGGKRNPDGQGFAAFGRVVKGMDVVRKIQAAPAKGQTLSPPVKIVCMRRKEG